MDLWQFIENQLQFRVYKNIGIRLYLYDTAF